MTTVHNIYVYLIDQIDEMIRTYTHLTLNEMHERVVKKHKDHIQTLELLHPSFDLEQILQDRMS